MIFFKTKETTLHTPLTREEVREILEKNEVEHIDVTNPKGRAEILKLIEIPVNQLEDA